MSIVAPKTSLSSAWKTYVKGRTAVVWQGNICFCIIEGHLCEKMADDIVDRFERFMCRDMVAPPPFFFHWQEMSSYASYGRRALTQWAFDHRHQVGKGHFLVRSRIVNMGISVANSVLGFLVTHPDPTSFFAALEEEAGPGFRARVEQLLQEP